MLSGPTASLPIKVCHLECTPHFSEPGRSGHVQPPSAKVHKAPKSPLEGACPEEEVSGPSQSLSHSAGAQVSRRAQCRSFRVAFLPTPELFTKKKNSRGCWNTNSTILKEHVLKELSPRGGSSWSEFLSSERNVPHTCLIEGPGLGPPYKPHSLSHPRPGRSETRRGKQVFLIRAPGRCLAPASLGIPGAEYRVFFSRLFW